MEKIRIGIVNYLNTKPLLYGIERSGILERADLVPDYPSRVAEQLLDGSIDVGLVPVAIIPKLREAHLVTNYCIGCDGLVASVAIFSSQPLEEVRRLLLDYQSRTSVALARILLREYWNLQPGLVDAREEDLAKIGGGTAAVLIGDRALEQRLKSPYIYDLGEAWKELTGLPFVFAAWVSNKQLDPSFISEFDAANGLGLRHIPEIVAANPYPSFDLNAYYTRHISYTLDKAKYSALELFIGKLKDYTL